MELPSAYIPMDRRQAIAQGQILPDRTSGAALFADISGFTPLTESLLNSYGPRRGAEELTKQLNLIYDALVKEVHRYRGSVMAFSGDAITCWFDGDVGLLAVACGLAMQQAMGQFAAVETPSGDRLPLRMTVGVAAGPVRRFQVGDPQIQYIDALAGATLDDMATAERMAEKGEVAITPTVMANLQDELELGDLRTHEENGQTFAVALSLKNPDKIDLETIAWPALSEDTLSEEQQKPWMLPPIYERLSAEGGQFLAELRPGVPLFLYFDGIDYDDDEEAGQKLDSYIRWVQKILARYDAYLFQLTIGDKGSYLYTAFGSPIAHEDDAARSVAAALDLHALPDDLDFIDRLQIGVSQGQLYTGAYGGSTRRTYGVLGDEVNLAARLMGKAEPGQILVSQRVQETAANRFSWEKLDPFKVKGKSNEIIAYRPHHLKERRDFHLSELKYQLPMVGRTDELALIQEKLELALSGQGQFIGITAEAGMGKSRLVAEVIPRTIEHQMEGYGGECQSYGTNISYLVWQPVWQSFFGIDPTWELQEQIYVLETVLNEIDPTLTPRLPLLGNVLNLEIPDSELTQSFDAKLRKTSLESLLIDCLRARAQQTPLVIVLEDSHWIDPLSLELLEVMSGAIAHLPVLVIMAYRPPDKQQPESPIERLPNFTKIELTHFTPEESERLITLKLSEFSDDDSKVPAGIIKRITDRAQGNPFYIEELLNYLRDQGIDPHDSDALKKLDLPDSLQTLILSRIDRLTENQKSVLRIASVIGRLFRAAWVWGMYPDLKEEPVKEDLSVLSTMDLTPVDSEDPEIIYLFKHIVTQEVAYESLPYGTRSLLHNYLGEFIESKYSKHINQYLDLLAFHYGRSDNKDKQRTYLRLAGEAAQADYANEAAIDYYRKVLPLLEDEEKVAILRKLGDVLQLLGQWDEAGKLYNQALTLAESLDDNESVAWCQWATGELYRKQGIYADALVWFERAEAGFKKIGVQSGVGQVLHSSGTLAAQQGDYDSARKRYEESLSIRRSLHDKANTASLLSNLAILAEYQGDYDTARSLNEESLANRWDIGDKWAIAVSLNNLGNVLLAEGEYDMAVTQLEIAVNLQREVGDRWYLANALNNLANATRAQTDYQAARSLYIESLTINRDLGDGGAIAYLLEDIGSLAALEKDALRALRLFGAATVLRENLGAPLPPSDKQKLDETLNSARQLIDHAEATAAEAAGQAMSLDEAIDEALQLAA